VLFFFSGEVIILLRGLSVDNYQNISAVCKLDLQRLCCCGLLRERFSANLQTLPGAVADPKTMDWWAGQPEARAACRQDLELPESAMQRYAAWLAGQGDRLITDVRNFYL
jgi:hypothetical protein